MGRDYKDRVVGMSEPKEFDWDVGVGRELKGYNGPQKEFLDDLQADPVLYGHAPAFAVEPRLVWAHELPDGRRVVPAHLENAVVYRVGARRFLTKKAAIKNYAWQRIKARYKCTCEPDVGYDCNQHDYVEALVKRYIRFLTPRLFKNAS